MKSKIKYLFLGLLTFSLVPAMASCDSIDPYAPLTPEIDYVAQTKLTQNYVGMDFASQGIGEVDLRRAVDGDTAHFYPVGQTRGEIKLRFIGVDTPESTGQVEKWGKGAANFTKDKLENATHIVLSSESDAIKPAEHDSTGRILGFVWVTDVENPTLDDFKLLNLWLVQECFSSTKGISGSKYASVFYNADLQAQEMNRRIWNENEVDPLFDPNEEFHPTTIQGIYDAYDDDPDNVGYRVKFEGTISRMTDNGMNFYLQDTFEENGEEFTMGIYVFSGYKSFGFQEGYRLLVFGRVSEYMNNLQITDVKYNNAFPSEEDIQILDYNAGKIEPRVLTPNEMVSEDNRGTLMKSSMSLVAYDGYGGTGSSNPTDEDAFTLNLYGLSSVTVDEMTGEIKYTTDTSQSIQLRIQSTVSFKEGLVPVRNYEWFLNRPFDLIGIGSLYVNEYTGAETPQVLCVQVSDLMWITAESL